MKSARNTRIVLIALAVRLCALADSNPHLPVLHSIKEVLNLSNVESDKGYPFHLRAQVTLFSPKTYWFFLQDAADGIYSWPGDIKTFPKAGDWVDIEGITGRGGFAPILLPTVLNIVGHSSMPTPLKADDPSEPVPEAANLWASLRGQLIRSHSVADAGKGSLDFDLVTAQNGRIEILMASAEGCHPAALVNAMVEAHGVLGIRLRALAIVRLAHFMLIAAAISPLPRAHENWSLPLVPIDQLLVYRSGTKIDDMLRVRGVVTFINNLHQFYVQNGTSGILVEPIVGDRSPKGRR